MTPLQRSAGSTQRSMRNGGAWENDKADKAPAMSGLGGMQTSEILRALRAVGSTPQLGHEALHAAGSSFELLNSKELIGLVGLGDVAWTADDGRNTRTLK